MRIKKTMTFEQSMLAASDRRQLGPGMTQPGGGSARDTIKTSRILGVSALLNGIRNPNCPDYKAHTGPSDWSCVNLIKFLVLSVSCAPQTSPCERPNIETIRQVEHMQGPINQWICN